MESLHKMFNDFDHNINFANYKPLYNSDGKLHSEIHPALIVDGNWYYSIQFFLNGVKHRNLKPANIEVNKSSLKSITRTWSKNGVWHRFNAPAYIGYQDDGKTPCGIKFVEYGNLKNNVKT